MEVGAPITYMWWYQTNSWCVCFRCLSCSIKFRKWQAIREEVDKECSELCTTVGTVTTTIGILIHSRIKALADNLSQPAIGCIPA